MATTGRRFRLGGPRRGVDGPSGDTRLWTHRARWRLGDSQRANAFRPRPV